jgi:hypothetical protein
MNYSYCKHGMQYLNVPLNSYSQRSHGSVVPPAMYTHELTYITSICLSRRRALLHGLHFGHEEWCLLGCYAVWLL